MKRESFGPLLPVDSLDNWQQKKQRRMYEIAQILKVRRRVDFTRFVAELSIRCGFDERTARRYINTFKDFGAIRIENHEIIWIETSDDESLC
jgi:predicted DNA-binding transcriptional regulator YafY